MEPERMRRIKATKPVAEIDGDAGEDLAELDIQGRLTSELVLAMVGPVASGVSVSAASIKKSLVEKYKYSCVEVIKVSEFIERFSGKVSVPVDSVGLAGRIKSFQTAGNAIREKFGADFLAKCAVQRISELRAKDGFIVGDDGSKGIPKPVRRVYIIDSLKNNEEWRLLRDVYGSIFWMIGVSAADKVRSGRLRRLGVERADIPNILSRDLGEKSEFGQRVRKLFSNADFFIRNDGVNVEDVDHSVERLLSVLFGARIVSPTAEESAMFSAANAATRSACMSRQVGAAVLSPSGEIISLGWNDVPRYGGGLYDEASKATGLDARCFRWGDESCHNDVEKQRIEDQVVEGIAKAQANALALVKRPGVKVPPVVVLDNEAIRAAVRSSGVSSLIEFSRAVHAEMAAILSVARDKRHSLVGSMMVVTTYPCHNCARHIVASGVEQVIYLEPYEKSLAMHLHPDSVSDDEADVGKKCVFKQFQGFAPRHILSLFSSGVERKRAGKRVSVDPSVANPIFRRSMDSFVLYEDRIAYEVSRELL